MSARIRNLLAILGLVLFVGCQNDEPEIFSEQLPGQSGASKSIELRPPPDDEANSLRPNSARTATAGQPARPAGAGNRTPNSRPGNQTANPIGDETPAHRQLASLENQGSYSPQGEYEVLSEAELGKGELWRARATHGSVYRIDVSPDGQTIAVATVLWKLRSVPGIARVVSAKDGSLVKELIGHMQGIGTVRFSSDGKRLLTGSWDKTARVWDVAEGKELLAYRDHIWPILAVASSPDGERAVTASDGFRVRLAVSGAVKKQVPMFHPNHPIWDIDFSADGQRLLTGSGDGTVAVWDLQSLEQVWQRGDFGWVRCVSFSPDGSLVMAASVSHDAVRLLNAATGELVRELAGREGGTAAAAFSPDGRYVATGAGEMMPGGGMLNQEPIERSIHIWEMESGRQLLQLDGHTKAITALAFLGGGHKLVSAGADGTLRLWDVSGIDGNEKPD